MIETDSVAQPPSRPFVPQSVYRFLRHPVYLSVLALYGLCRL
jgi:protein-S-isoprenylcysteine O-methyltransferase Ste14